MSDQTPEMPAQPVGGEEAAGPQLMIEKVFLKDVSFEAPNVPEIFTEEGQQEIQLNMSQRTRSVDGDRYMVILTVTVTSKIAGTTAFLAEVQQGGFFQLAGFEENQLHAALGTICPAVLFPYARQQISDLVINGGFPPLLLQHMNFDALYADQLRQKQQEAQMSAPSGEGLN